MSIDITTTADIAAKQVEIEEKMYELLTQLHALCLPHENLEGCVLRELRHLQEYVTHRYPRIAEYLRTPFVEVIACVQLRTKGLNVVKPFYPYIIELFFLVIISSLPINRMMVTSTNTEST
jgi:hypothetical protein